MIKSFDDFLQSFSKWGVTLCVALMLSLTILNIALRWFEISILWIEPLVRHLVFLAAFFGGSLATGDNQHIKIDIVSRFLEKADKPLLSKWLEVLITLVAFTAAVTLVVSSVNLSLVEFEYGKKEFLNIHSGFLVSIIPFGMSLISLRLFLRVLLFTFKKVH